MPDIEFFVLTRWFDWLIANTDCHIDLIGKPQWEQLNSSDNYCSSANFHVMKL